MKRLLLLLILPSRSTLRQSRYHQGRNETAMKHLSLIAILLACALTVICFAGCGADDNEPEPCWKLFAGPWGMYCAVGLQCAPGMQIHLIARFCRCRYRCRETPTQF